MTADAAPGADPMTEQRQQAAHPDDGHKHWFACIRCGVDNGLNNASPEAVTTAGLRERLATALCSTFDLGHHHHEAFLQPDHCDDGLADADQLLPYLADLTDATGEPRQAEGINVERRLRLAEAVAEDRVTRNALQVLAAVVMAAGGQVEVPLNLTRDRYEVMVEDTFDGKRYTARALTTDATGEAKETER